LRLEADRRHLTLPVIGRLRCKENTRRLERLLAKGQARVLSMTLSEHGGRLVVSVATIIAHSPAPRASPTVAAGSTSASASSGPWSHMLPAASSGSPILPPGLRPTPSTAGPLGRRPAASSAPEATAKRASSWRPLTDARPTCVASRCTP
jgi:hypothetical protein